MALLESSFRCGRFVFGFFRGRSGETGVTSTDSLAFNSISPRRTGGGLCQDGAFCSGDGAGSVTDVAFSNGIKSVM
jgi:hypothetical protein